MHKVAKGLIRTLCLAAALVLAACAAPSANAPSASAPSANAPMSRTRAVSEQAVAAPTAVPARVEARPQFIDFYATWCTVCQAMKPTVERIKKEYAGQITFTAYNIDETSQDIFDKYKFIGRPQFVVLNPAGDIVASRNGMVPYETLKADLDQVLAKRAER